MISNQSISLEDTMLFRNRRMAVHPAILFSVLLMVLFSATHRPALAQTMAQRHIPVTFDPSGRRLTTYEEYLRGLGPPTPFQAENIYQTKGLQDGGRESKSSKILIVVNSSIQSAIQSSLYRYTTDLESAGHAVTLWATSGGTPADIKAHIISESSGLVGILLIGDLPVPWFEMYYDFYIDDDWDGLIDEDPIDGMDNDGDGDTDEDPPYDNDGDGLFNEDHLDNLDNDGDTRYDEDTYDGSTAQFPCDLYYMDLDGTWEDSEPDGLFDIHRSGTGDLGPEVFVGRLTASPMTLAGADEVSLLINYFDKNHEYRIGDLTAQERALVYVDDDWAFWANMYNADVQLAYPTTVLVKNKAQTCRDDYRDTRLPGNHEWMHVMLHSSWTDHFFKVNDNWELDSLGYYATVSNADIESIDPVALFYNLFACSNCRYVENDYMGGWYIFVGQHGLGAVGCTKTGSMLDFDQFYGPLGQEAGLGEAFRQWFDYEATYDLEARGWFYGMTLLGDPTLCPRVPPLVTDLEIDLAENDIVLTWHTSGTKAIDHYVIYRSTDPGFEPGHSDSIGQTAGNTYVDPGAAKDAAQNYYYSVRSVDGAGHKSASSNRVGEYDVDLINAPPSK
jgi:hypothetical protein